ncbi:hypothetical protein ACFX19_028299 [Malus domestica]
MLLLMTMMKRIIIMLRRIITGDSHHLVLGRLKISREVVTVLDRRAVVQVPIHLEGVAGPLAVHVFIVKRTLVIMVLNSATGSTIVIPRNIIGEVVDATCAARWGIELINALRIRNLHLLHYHLQFFYNRFQDLVPTNI